jgi:hypothetical protein
MHSAKNDAQHMEEENEVENKAAYDEINFLRHEPPPANPYPD